MAVHISHDETIEQPLAYGANQWQSEAGVCSGGRTRQLREPDVCVPTSPSLSTLLIRCKSLLMSTGCSEESAAELMSGWDGVPDSCALRVRTYLVMRAQSPDEFKRWVEPLAGLI